MFRIIQLLFIFIPLFLSIYFATSYHDHLPLTTTAGGKSTPIREWTLSLPPHMIYHLSSSYNVFPTAFEAEKGLFLSRKRVRIHSHADYDVGIFKFMADTGSRFYFSSSDYSKCHFRNKFLHPEGEENASSFDVIASYFHLNSNLPVSTLMDRYWTELNSSGKLLCHVVIKKKEDLPRLGQHRFRILKMISLPLYNLMLINLHLLFDLQKANGFSHQWLGYTYVVFLAEKILT